MKDPQQYKGITKKNYISKVSFTQKFSLNFEYLRQSKEEEKINTKCLYFKAYIVIWS